ncbi:MAG: c-type cytochrome [Gemmatimonadales bacterium]
MNRFSERIRVTGAAVWMTLAAAVVVGACANGGDSASTPSDAASRVGEQPAAEAGGGESGQSVEQPAQEVDVQLATRGEGLFTQRGCVACHKIGEGRLVGPDLMGVTERRSYEWIHAMITAPDSMLQNDSTAKALFAEYFTPMPDQKVQPAEARALYENLRARTEGVMPSSAVSGSGADMAMVGHRHRHGAGMQGRMRMRRMLAVGDDQPGGPGPRAGRGPPAGHGGQHHHQRGTSF